MREQVKNEQFHQLIVTLLVSFATVWMITSCVGPGEGSRTQLASETNSNLLCDFEKWVYNQDGELSIHPLKVNVPLESYTEFFHQEEKVSISQSPNLISLRLPDDGTPDEWRFARIRLKEETHLIDLIAHFVLEVAVNVPRVSFRIHCSSEQDHDVQLTEAPQEYTDFKCTSHYRTVNHQFSAPTAEGFPYLFKVTQESNDWAFVRFYQNSNGYHVLEMAQDVDPFGSYVRFANDFSLREMWTTRRGELSNGPYQGQSLELKFRDAAKIESFSVRDPGIHFVVEGGGPRVFRNTECRGPRN